MAVNNCQCRDYKKSMPQIIDPQRIAFVRHKIKYTGKAIIYCPWCGNKLEEVEAEEGE